MFTADQMHKPVSYVSKAAALEAIERISRILCASTSGRGSDVSVFYRSVGGLHQIGTYSIKAKLFSRIGTLTHGALAAIMQRHDLRQEETVQGEGGDRVVYSYPYAPMLSPIPYLPTMPTEGPYGYFAE